MATKRIPRPRDPLALAKLIGDIATGQVEDGKNEAAVELGRRGGLKGGRARAKSLSAARRSEIAALAVSKRRSGKPQN